MSPAGQIRLKHRLDPATLRSVADYRRLIPALGADDLLLAFLARAINVDAELGARARRTAPESSSPHRLGRTPDPIPEPIWRHRR